MYIGRESAVILVAAPQMQRPIDRLLAEHDRLIDDTTKLIGKADHVSSQRQVQPELQEQPRQHQRTRQGQRR